MAIEGIQWNLNHFFLPGIEAGLGGFGASGNGGFGSSGNGGFGSSGNGGFGSSGQGCLFPVCVAGFCCVFRVSGFRVLDWGRADVVEDVHTGRLRVGSASSSDQV